MDFKFSIFWKELVLFASAQFLGIWSAFKFFPKFKETFDPSIARFTSTDILVLIIIGAIFFALLRKPSRGSNLFIQIFLIFVLFSGSQIVFFSFFSESLAVFLALLVIISYIFFRNILIHNIAMILGIAGIGAIFGLSITPIIAVIILLALSFYDIIAVYWTKHMIKMAEGMIKSGAIFGLIIPERVSEFVKISAKQAKPGRGFMILGSGDVIMPIILSASLIKISLLASFIVGFFAVGGLFLMHIIFSAQKVRRPMAALPPIAVMSIIGYLVTIIFNF